jgi:hypothetical protein
MVIAAHLRRSAMFRLCFQGLASHQVPVHSGFLVRSTSWVEHVQLNKFSAVIQHPHHKRFGQDISLCCAYA